MTGFHRGADCASACLFGCRAHIRLLLKPVSATGNGHDITRRPPLVAELHAQLPDVTVDDVALDLELTAPDRREQIFAAQGFARVRGEEIEKRLLDRSELKVAARNAYALFNEVHLKTVEP